MLRSFLFCVRFVNFVRASFADIAHSDAARRLSHLVHFGLVRGALPFGTRPRRPTSEIENHQNADLLRRDAKAYALSVSAICAAPSSLISNGGVAVEAHNQTHRGVGRNDPLRLDIFAYCRSRLGGDAVAVQGHWRWLWIWNCLWMGFVVPLCVRGGHSVVVFVVEMAALR